MPNPLTGQNYTTAQLTTLLNEMNGDPYLLGYAAYIPGGGVNPDVNHLVTLLNWLRDGVNPCTANGVIGPSGAVSGATNANPVVITTSAPHGLSSGNAVTIAGVGGNTSANGFSYVRGGINYTQPFFANVLSTTTFSLFTTPALSTGVAGNGAYTSGGTWQWLVASLANNSFLWSPEVSTSDILANLAIGDCSAAPALTGTQASIMPTYLAPGQSIQLTNAAGVTLNAAGWIGALPATGTTSSKAIRALEARLGSRAEQILNLVNQTSPGMLVTAIDLQAAFIGHY